MKIHILLATLLFAAPALVSAQNDAKDDPAGNLQKFQQFYRYLNGAYVDTVHNNELVESAIREVLLQLDPHSTYVSPEEMVEVKESFDGSFSGIGIEFNVLRDTIIVVNVISGGPAEQVGLLPNDRIVAVDGKSSVGIKQIDVPKLLRGPKGSRVETRIVRHGGGEPLDFTIVRDNIPINTVDAAYKVDPKTGYIRINRFANNTYKEFTDAVQKLGPMDALILDLRSNGGGLMGGAVQLSNFFLPEGSVIVSTEGMRVPPDRIVAKEDGPFTKGKVIVLINETSASASEIVSGAIQDWDRGLLIGRRTFGKGLVQRQFPLQDGSAVRLTVARYHTPTGRMIQRPYENGNLDAYYEDFNKRFEPGASDSVGGDTTQRFKTLRSGRTVYGGHRRTARYVGLYEILGQPGASGRHQRIRHRIPGREPSGAVVALRGSRKVRQRLHRLRRRARRPDGQGHEKGDRLRRRRVRTFEKSAENPTESVDRAKNVGSQRILPRRQRRGRPGLRQSARSAARLGALRFRHRLLIRHETIHPLRRPQIGFCSRRSRIRLFCPEYLLISLFLFNFNNL